MLLKKNTKTNRVHVSGIMSPKRQAIRRLSREKFLLFFIVIIFGIVGSAWLTLSHAATTAINIEAESGSIRSPARSTTDTAASNGSAIVFGSEATEVRFINDRGIGFNYTDYPSHTPAQMQRDFADMKAIGASWVRLDISWNAIQPTGPTTYNWTNYDNYVNSAVNAGLKVDGIIMFTPIWAVSTACKNDSTIAHKQICPANDPSIYAAFAQAAVQRYGQKLSAVEIWNEPNIYQFWAPAPDATEYVTMLKAAYTAIKSVDANMLVISAGLSPAANYAPHYINQIKYLQQMYALGAKNYMDAVGYHPYDGGWPATYYNVNSPWSQIFQTPTSIHSVMAANGDGIKRVWLTEFGAPTGGAGGPYPSTAGIANCSNYSTISGRPTVDECLQALMLQTAIAVDMQNSTVLGPMMLYSYLDRGIPGQDGNQENHYGIVNTDLTHKQAYAAVVQAIKDNP